MIQCLRRHFLMAAARQALPQQTFAYQWFFQLLRLIASLIIFLVEYSANETMSSVRGESEVEEYTCACKLTMLH